jgi:hypothetical protein
MAKNNFILMSMEDKDIKKVSNVIGNDSCRKILDNLADKDCTESELSKKLNIPISTVHYNLLQLIQTGLVNSDEYHYSKKGKEMNHYRLANKYIVIAPKKTKGIKEKLRGILPVALIVSGTALVLHYTQKFFSHSGSISTFTQTKQTLVREISSHKIDKAVVAGDITVGAAAEPQELAASASGKALAESSPEIINKTSEYLLEPQVLIQTVTNQASPLSNIALWFLAGAVFALLVYLLVTSIRKE